MPFYNDDGTEINPDDIIIPDKCLKCKKYSPKNIADDDPCPLTEEWENNVLCTLTRIGYKSDDDFHCCEYIFNRKWRSNLN